MFVPIALEGGRNLRLGIREILEIEQRAGKTIGHVVEDLKAFGINTLILCLVVGLKHEEPSINVNLVTKRVESHLESGKLISPIFDAVAEALNKSKVFGGGDETEASERPTKAAGAATTTAD